MTDPTSNADIVVTRGGVRGTFGAISLFRDTVPQAYEPIEGEFCTIIRHAMVEVKKVYCDAEHRDRLAGSCHAEHAGGRIALRSSVCMQGTHHFAQKGRHR